MSQIYQSDQQSAVIRSLRAGGIGVLRTDTLYGIVADAAKAEAVERLYAIRGRDADKPVVVLIGELSQIWQAELTDRHRRLFERYWPGKVSIILPAGEGTEHIHRGYNSIAYRLPADGWLRQLLKATGPLAAPSANPQGQPPAADIHEAQGYFGNTVDFYVDQGRVENTTPSQLLQLHADGTVRRLR